MKKTTAEVLEMMMKIRSVENDNEKKNVLCIVKESERMANEQKDKLKKILVMKLIKEGIINNETLKTI